MIQGATEAVLTNLDVLGYLDDIPVCVGYELADGITIDQFPVTAELQTAKPVLRTLKGWKCDLSHIRSFEELPEAAQQYVQYIESSIGVPIKTVSVGPRRDQVMTR